MSRISSFLSTLTRRHGLYLAFAAILLATLTACGGGGGDNGTVITDDPVPPLPSRVKYLAGGPGGDPGTTGMFMLDNALNITTTFYLAGSYVPASKLYTLTLSPVPRLVISPSGQSFNLPVSDAFGRFNLLIEDSLQWTYGQNPTSGRFSVAYGNYIRVAVNNDIDNAGTPGVDISLVEFGDTTASATLSWTQFKDALTNASAPAYQREAALAYLTLQRVYQPLNRVVENFSTIAQQESALEATGSSHPLAVPLCTTFNASTGSFNLTWIDGSGGIIGSLGPSDSFTIGVDNCWVDDPTTNSDLLYASGQMQLNNYEESTIPFALSFNDVVLTDLQVTQTEQTGPGTGTLGDSTLYNTFSTITGRNGFYLGITPDVSGTLNLVNVKQMAEATAQTFTLPSELGNFAVNLLSDALASAALSGTVTCPFGGTYDYTLSNNPFINGATMAVTFHDCVQGTVSDQTKVNGSYLLTTSAYTSTDNLAFNLALSNVTSQDNIGTSMTDGQMQFARVVNSGTSNEVSSSVSGQSLNMSESGVSASLSNFSISGSRTISGLTLGVPNETFTLQLSTLTDPLSGVITTTFSGPEMTALEAGSVRVTAPDSSNLLLTITDTTGAVSLALDSDGNGIAEDTVSTSWSDLY